MDFYFQSSFIPPPQHGVRTKGSALTFTDRVHSSDGSASFASVHVRMHSHTAATCPYALAHIPACSRKGGRREGLRMGLKKRKWGTGPRERSSQEKRWKRREANTKWRWREAVEEDIEWGRGDIHTKHPTVRWLPTDAVNMDVGQLDWLTHFMSSCYRKTHRRHKKGPRQQMFFFFSFISFLLFFFFFLSLFSMLQCYSERDAWAHALPEREGSEWIVCMCVSSCVPARESQTGMKLLGRYTGTYTVRCKQRGTYIQYGTTRLKSVLGYEWHAYASWI